MLVAGTAGHARADDVFSSDRPGYANGVLAAPVAALIAETGATVTWDELDAPTLALPALRLRVGVLPWLETRIDLPNLTTTLGDPVGFAGSPIALALKLAGNVHPKIGLSLIPSFAFGVQTPTQARIEINFNIALGPLGIAGNFALATSRALERNFSAEGSVALNLQLHSKLGAFVQTFAILESKIHTFVGGGLYVQLLETLQMDLWADVGLLERSPRFAGGVGATLLYR